MIYLICFRFLLEIFMQLKTEGISLLVFLKSIIACGNLFSN